MKGWASQVIALAEAAINYYFTNKHKYCKTPAKSLHWQDFVSLLIKIYMCMLLKTNWLYQHDSLGLSNHASEIKWQKCIFIVLIIRESKKPADKDIR